MKFQTVILVSTTAVTLLQGVACAATTTYNQSWIINAEIPDAYFGGLADTRNLTTGITTIDEITLNVQTSGGWNGDLYAYLQHETGFAIILNRVGRTAANPAGGNSVGLNLNFFDNALGDVHTTLPTGSGFVTGNYQPDGRNVDPSTVLDTTQRTTALSSFNGLAADGNWTLFIADAATGDTATLDSWALSITGTAIPEPSSTLFLALAGLVLASRRNRNQS